MKKIFLSGGNGFVGKNFSDAYSSVLEIEAPGRLQLELADIEAVDHYFSQRQFDCIIHGANVGGTRKNQKPLFYCLNENLRAFSHLFKQRNSASRFIQLGSGAEYGRPLKIPQINESYLEKQIPGDEYGFSKLLSSQLIKTEPPQKAVTLHLFGIFGRYEDYQMRFISNAILRTLSGLSIVINQDVKFDYLYVNDCVKIIHEFINRPAEFSNYNLGSGYPIKLSEIAEVIRATLGTQNDIIIKTPGLGHEYTCDNNRLVDFLGKNFAFTPLAVSIKELADWYEKNLAALNQDWILNPC